MAKLWLQRWKMALHAHVSPVLFVFVLFAMGSLFGFMLVMALSIDQHQQLSSFIGGFLQLAIQGDLVDIRLTFWQSYSVHVKWIAITWMLGISVIGLPLIALLDFIKGALIGFTVGYLATQFSWKGLLFSLGAVLPSNLLVVPALLISSAAAISFSVFLVRARLQPGGYGIAPTFWKFTLLHVCMLIVMAGAALIEVFISPHLLRWLAPMMV